MQFIKHTLSTLCLCLGLYSQVVPATNLMRQYHLPPLDRAPANSDTRKLIQQSKVFQRVQAVPIGLTQIEDPEQYQQQLLKNIQTQLPSWSTTLQTQVLTGKTTHELNQQLLALKPTADQPIQVSLPAQQLIRVDEPLQLPSYIFLHGNQAKLLSEQNHTAVIQLVGKQHIGLHNLHIQTPGLAILIKNSTAITVNNITTANVGRGIAVLGDSQAIELSQLLIDRPQAGGILIQGNVHHLWLHSSHIRNGQRSDNGGAALLVSDAQSKNTIEDMTRIAAIAEKILPVGQTPHAILIENNQFNHNRAQGIYLDGSYGVVVRNNQIGHNDKEGICLDFGAVHNILMDNEFNHNGFRANQTDLDLKHDLIFDFGRLADGSAVSKLPAISLDNAGENIILRNTILNSAGDGIKIVRTGIRNLILFNTILDNNQGDNSRFHFFGILLGSAGLENNINSHDHPLDFLPSLENIVGANLIYGQHWSGILFDKGAAFNDVYDNIVRHYRHAPHESASQQHNSVVGNSWNKTIR